jgi:hypothetical protein
MALNAPQVSAQERTDQAAVAAPPGPFQSKVRERRAAWTGGDIRIFQHSNLFYWWVVWLYGFVCAGLTAAQGFGIKELAAAGQAGQEKVILFHASPWLGLSFIGVVLFVVVFTNVRARGVYSFVLVLLAAAMVWGINKIPGIDTAVGWVSLLRVFSNLAFYLTFSTLLMLIWFFVTFFVDHFTWWRFSPGQVIEEHRVGQATGHAYNTEGMIIRRLPDDLFRHRLMGFGTGDFVVRPASGETFEIHNVWRANRKQRLLEKMIATRSVSDA